MGSNAGPPVAVIGAGPVGLVTAAQLVARGETPIVLEAGRHVGESIRAWGHVRLFSPWRHLTDPVSRRMLEDAGWHPPDPDRHPTGRELVEAYLEPLASLPRIAPHLRTERRVVAVTRAGMDKVRTEGRERVPFSLVVERGDGTRERIAARAVIDASGSWTAPNPLGAAGIPAEGEAEAADRVRSGVPDVLGRERARYAGRRTLVVGSGHSAFHALLALAQLAREEGGGEVWWAIRRDRPGFGGGALDALPARGSLGAATRALVATGAVRLRTGFRVERISRAEGALRVESPDGSIGPIDEIVAATGFRPELAPLRELRLGLDPWLECPAALAPLIDPNLHSCGTVPPHGFETLAHPEPGFFIVGAKSYGRAPTFLLATGYEQARSVVAAVTGDLESARRVELVLPETGVCSGDGAAAECCAPVPAARAGACCA